MTNSTVSSESAPRSSTKEASFVTSSSFTPNCSATMALTCCSILLIGVRVLYEAFKPFSKPTLFSSLGGSHGRRILGQDPGGSNICKTRRKIESTKALDSASDHVHAAVHVQRLTGDVARLWRRKKRDCRGDVLDCTQSSERDLRSQSGLLFSGQLRGHVGRDETGRHHVHGDAARTHFARQRLAETDDAGLRRRVVGLPRVAHHPDD